MSSVLLLPHLILYIWYEGAYDYLLGMPMWSLTYEKVEQLKQEASEKKAELERITVCSA